MARKRQFCKYFTRFGKACAKIWIDNEILDKVKTKDQKQKEKGYDKSLFCASSPYLNLNRSMHQHPVPLHALATTSGDLQKILARTMSLHGRQLQTVSYPFTPYHPSLFTFPIRSLHQG